MPNLELKPIYLSELRDVILRLLPKHEVWAFGSRMNQQSHSGSDLDLVIRNPLNLEVPCTELAAFKTALQESNIPILIDVIDWATIPIAFRHEILKQYQIIYTPSS